MCKFCERRRDVTFGWNQPAIPYGSTINSSEHLSGNAIDEPEKWEARIHDYQTACPSLILTRPDYFDGEGMGTVYIPIKYCPICGRKLGAEGVNWLDFLPTEREMPLLESIKAVERDGLSVRIHSMTFEILKPEIKLKDAIMGASTEYCNTKDGRKVYYHNCGAFNWTDFWDNVPNEICEKYGFRKQGDIISTENVDCDESLVVDEFLRV